MIFVVKNLICKKINYTFDKTFRKIIFILKLNTMNENTLNILLCEGNEDLGVIIREYLNSKNYHADLFTDVKSAVSAFEKNNYSMSVLDIKLFDGFDLINKMHEKDPDIYILLLLPKAYTLPSERKNIEKEGYLYKPFSVSDLASIIKIKNRNKNRKNSDKSKGGRFEPKNTDIFEIGNYTFEVQRRQLIREDRSIRLTNKEAELLHILAEHANSITDRNVFIDKIWNYEGEYYSKSRSMDVYICKLRKHLEKDSKINIVNIHGRGYNLIAPVKKTL